MHERLHTELWISIALLLHLYATSRRLNSKQFTDNRSIDIILGEIDR
jgi:hypothetical protein